MLINLNLSASTPSWLPLPLCSSLAHCRRMSCACVEYITLRFAQSFILFSKLKKKKKKSKGSSSRHLPVRELRSTILNGICHAPATASPHPFPIHTSYIYLCKNKLLPKFASIFFELSGYSFASFFGFGQVLNLLCEKVRNSFCFLLLLPPAALRHFLLSTFVAFLCISKYII